MTSTRRPIILLALLALAVPAIASEQPAPAEPALKLVQAARAQIGVTTGYDGAWRRIGYPMGDVPISTGVCTDVVIRAWRGQGVDLQQLVHEDMRRAWQAYPKQWGLKRPDTNIDHRRVPNLATFFKRHGHALPASRNLADYQPGDMVTWMLPGNLPHIGIVSNRKGADGAPLVIPHVSAGTQEENALLRWPITGHYRYRPAPRRGTGSER